jgi:hypothetical protein
VGFLFCSRDCDVSMEVGLTVAEVHSRIRWVRICMALLLFQDDMRVATEIAGTKQRRPARWEC